MATKAYRIQTRQFIEVKQVAFRGYVNSYSTWKTIRTFTDKQTAIDYVESAQQFKQGLQQIRIMFGTSVEWERA